MIAFKSDGCDLATSGGHCFRKLPVIITPPARRADNQQRFVCKVRGPGLIVPFGTVSNSLRNHAEGGRTVEGIADIVESLLCCRGQFALWNFAHLLAGRA